MDAAHTGQMPPPRKMLVDKFADGSLTCLRFGGTLDEEFEGQRLAAAVKGDTLILDLGHVRKISSFGIREWIDFLNAVQSRVSDIILIECSPKIVDQLNMVGNFAGGGKVFSFYAPYRCDYCDADRYVLMQLDDDWDAIKSMKPPERPCGTCGEPEYFDEDPTTYFSFVASQDKFSLDPAIVAFMASKMNYAVSEGGQRLSIEKFVEGRATCVKLAGSLDRSFPREKLAEGLEGTVLIDLTGLGKIDPAGAAEWRGFLQMITPSADAIYLIGVSPGFLEKLAKPEDLGPKAQVATFTLPYGCSQCASTTSQVVDVVQHYDVLKFATPPEMTCGDCGAPSVCTAGEHLLSHLATLQQPAIPPEDRKLITDVQDRKPERAKRPTATTVAEAAAAGRGASWGMLLVAALVAAGLTLGGLFAYRYMQEQSASGGEVGDLVRASADARPGWLTSDARLSTYCTDESGGALGCVGVSSYADSEQAAHGEARDAALEAVTNAIALRIEDKAWNRSVAPIYTETRQAKLSAFFDKAQRDPASSQYERALREVREGRRAVAAALRKTGGNAVPTAPTHQYWEQYEAGSGGGDRYLAFARFQLSAPQIKRLVETYTAPHEALGVTAMTVFPGVAWRYEDIDSGAVITGLGDGKLAQIGLVERYIVQSVQDRVIKDAASLAQIAVEEVAQLERDGGNLKLVVKTGDDRPVEFNRPIESIGAGGTGGTGDKGAANPGTGGKSAGAGAGAGGARPSGAVNTWDRYGGK